MLSEVGFEIIYPFPFVFIEPFRRAANRREDRGGRRNCKRFAIPAEANRRPESLRLRSWKAERLQSYETERQHLHAVGRPFYWGAFFLRFRAIFLEVLGNLFGGSGESSKPLVYRAEGARGAKGTEAQRQRNRGAEAT